MPIAANLAHVAALISAEPRFRPRTLMVVSRMIAAMETRCPRVSVQPSNRRDRLMRRGKGKNRAEVFGEPDGERCDGAALADGEDHPAIEKCRELAIGLAQVDVLAAGFGIHRSHLGEGEAGEQRDHSADEPDAEKVQRLVDGGGDLSGGEKDA